MYNNGGIKKVTGAAPIQILANVQLQQSFGAVISQDLGVADDYGHKMVKAGTPVAGSLTARTTAFTDGSTNPVGILLHDVDVTAGDANGTVLVFGFVNLDRIDSTTKALITDDVISALDGKVWFITG